ncbi:MAG: DEAD/DEAH box helicase family protein [Anaerolineaceae bacterium]|jgi:hypothetical protein
MDKNEFVPSKDQEMAANFKENPSLFLRGNASTGKTTAALLRLETILHSQASGVGESVLVLVPQRSLGSPYQDFLSKQMSMASDQVSVLTMSSLLRRMIDLFWPLLASYQLFKHPYEKPAFLTLETSQFYMSQIVEPMLAQGKFSTISLPLYRLCSQLVDNLNKSALVGFSYKEIGSRLSSAWMGDASRQNVYGDVQEAVTKFRQLCLDNNLLDFSLQVELFKNYLWNNQSLQKYIQNQYHHIIYDNCEEDPPYVHDILIDWLPSFKSSLVIFDENSGFRSFLGADPTSALRLSKSAVTTLQTTQNFVSSKPLQELGNCFLDLQNCKVSGDLINETLVFPKERIRFFPDLLATLTKDIAHLLNEKGVSPDQIAILSPFVSESMQFSLEDLFSENGLKLLVQQPSMPMAQNAVVKTAVTLAKLSHPDWNLGSKSHTVSAALSLAIKDLDLVRSHLILGGFNTEKLNLLSLPEPGDVGERVPGHLIDKYEHLREWLTGIDPDEPLDRFLSRLFGEVLSQPDYGFHNDLQAGTGIAMLMESYRKFAQSLKIRTEVKASHIGRHFIESLENGLIPALYLSSWERQTSDQVLLAPVTSFLMRNEPVAYQFWLNIGSKGWYERLEQPLTHPIVLSRNWNIGRQWTSDDELAYNKQNLTKIINSLISRCSEKIYLYTSDYNESGVEERGQLLTFFQNLLRKSRASN